MKNKIIIVGAGGHAKSVLDVIETTRKFKNFLFLDDQKVGEKINKYLIQSESKYKKNLLNFSKNLIIGVGMINDLKIREKLFIKFKKKGFNFPVIISPYSYVSKKAKIGEGSIIMHGALVNSGAIIGKNCIINSKAIIEHDCRINDNCHIATGAIINGETIVGRNSFIGSNSTLRNNIKIKKFSFIKFSSKISKNT
jgi:sugar O-acyltransferase (sialic acid O-acetyltransferase NeuD family)